MEDKIEYQMKWNDYTQYAIGFSKLWCQIIGVWPWHRNRVFSTVRSGFLITVEVAASALLLERLLQNGNCGSRAYLIDALSSLSLYLVLAIKIFLLWYQHERMLNIIQSIIDDWSNVAETKSRDIMTQYAFWGRLAYIIETSMVLVVILEITVTRPPSFSIGTSENNSLWVRNFVLGPSCWVPPSMSTTLYLMHYYIGLCGIFAAAIVYPGFDAFMFSIVLHICGQFEILNSSTENITDEDGYWEQRYKIKEYSQRHAKLLALSTQLDEIINVIILFTLLSNGFSICIAAISLLTGIKNGNLDNENFNVGIRICVCYVVLFMYSFVGEKLSIQAAKSQIAIYKVPWYNMPTTIAKDIQFIIMRSNSACNLTACGIMTMNYEAFKYTTRVMFSCFSVLQLALA